MRLGIMGGTFNPIHYVHLFIAQKALEQFNLDKVIFMTSGNPPHKNDDIVEASHRYNMTSLAISENNRFCASDYEVENQDYSYTVETMEYLQKKYPQAELYFIMGADSLRDILKWKNAKKLLTMCNFLAFNRGGIDIDTLAEIENLKKSYNAKVYFVDAPVFALSSTDIRERIKAGKDIKELVPDRVIEYINYNRLYK